MRWHNKYSVEILSILWACFFLSFFFFFFCPLRFELRIWSESNDLRSIILSTRQVTVVFQSGHPRNGAGPKNTFLTVEKFESDGGNWKQILADDDWSTKFEWNRRGISESTASVY